MLLDPGFMDYDNVIIFTPTKSQQEYQLLFHGYTASLKLIVSNPKQTKIATDFQL